MRTIKQYNFQRKLKFKLRKAVSLFNTGYIYAPYIPAQLEPVTVNNPLIGLSSRYASVQVNQNFYGQINLNSLNE